MTISDSVAPSTTAGFMWAARMRSSRIAASCVTGSGPSALSPPSPGSTTAKVPVFESSGGSSPHSGTSASDGVSSSSRRTTCMAWLTPITSSTSSGDGSVWSSDAVIARRANTRMLRRALSTGCTSRASVRNWRRRPHSRGDNCTCSTPSAMMRSICVTSFCDARATCNPARMRSVSRSRRPRATS